MIHTHGWWIGISCCLQASVPLSVGPSTELQRCLHGMLLPSPSRRHSRQRPQCFLGPSFSSYTVTSGILYWWHRSALFSGKGKGRGGVRCEYQEAETVEAIIEVDYPESWQWPLPDKTTGFCLDVFLSPILSQWKESNPSPMPLVRLIELNVIIVPLTVIGSKFQT